MNGVDYCVIKRPMSGVGDECGDNGIVFEYENQCFAALIDVLGHGKEAFAVATLIERYLLSHYKQDLLTMVKELHTQLQGTRGAVAAICRLNLDTGMLNYCGIGNIGMKIFGSKERRLVLKDGVLGYVISTPVERQVRLFPGDILIMNSDGIREHFDPVDFPELANGTAKTVCSMFIERLAKDTDDASCMVLRYGV